MTCAYYNENDLDAAAWLRELIDAGQIAPGVVDTRSIVDVTPRDLDGFDQCHFFAGIGAWSYALRLAGWPDDRRVWTGSCPCQPFSSAGKGDGFDDDRHLWPHWHWLISQCRPAVILGEQVEKAVAHGWLDLVQSDLEAIGYSVGHAAVPAGAVGAPHIRKRVWFVADASRSGPSQQRGRWPEHARRPANCVTSISGLANNNNNRCDPLSVTGLHDQEHNAQSRSRVLDHTDNARLEGHGQSESSDRWNGRQRESVGSIGPASVIGGFWSNAQLLDFRDGKQRPVEPGTFPLAHGSPARVVRLRGYGNAIVPQVAQAFIEAYVAARRSLEAEEL